MMLFANDEEVLRYAAKSIDFDLTGFNYFKQIETSELADAVGIRFFWGFKRGHETWNPYIDSNHAFYLMTMLEMNVDAGSVSEVCSASAAGVGVTTPITKHPLDAMREAITLCAATIGHGMV